MALKRLSSTCTEVSGLSENSDMNSVRGWVFNKPKSGPNETTQFTQFRQGYLSVPDLVMGFIACLLSISLQAPEGCREYWGAAGVKQVKWSPWEVVVSSWFNNPTWSMSCLSQIELERLVQVIKYNSLQSQATASLIPFIDQIKCISKWTFLYWFFFWGGGGGGWGWWGVGMHSQKLVLAIEILFLVSILDFFSLYHLLYCSSSQVAPLSLTNDNYEKESWKNAVRKDPVKHTIKKLFLVLWHFSLLPLLSYGFPKSFCSSFDHYWMQAKNAVVHFPPMIEREKPLPFFLDLRLLMSFLFLSLVVKITNSSLNIQNVLRKSKYSLASGWQ